MKVARLRRRILAVNRRFRQAQMIATALKSPRRPILAHLVPIRRCNLSCAYCNEHDDFSQPVPTAVMLGRVDLLAALGTITITISGGEPLLHPELEGIVRRIRGHNIIASVLTNGHLLNPERIKRLNRAGLDALQISIDNVLPDETSKKSLAVLDQKLQWLAEHAEFEVITNSVLGASIRNADDVPVIARRARELGFTHTIGILHDQHGQLEPPDGEQQQRAYAEITQFRDSVYGLAYYNYFQKNLIRGLPNDWHCHAGCRYLYVCEDGLVHYCSQRRGCPGIPLEQYTREDLERHYQTVKPCAPYCTISCVHQVGMIDFLRERPQEALARFFPAREKQHSRADLPVMFRALAWVFLPSKPNSKRRLLAKAALRLLGVS